jgi:hypothetical protein
MNALQVSSLLASNLRGRFRARFAQHELIAFVKFTQ